MLHSSFGNGFGLTFDDLRLRRGCDHPANREIDERDGSLWGMRSARFRPLAAFFKLAIRPDRTRYYVGCQGVMVARVITSPVGPCASERFYCTKGTMPDSRKSIGYFRQAVLAMLSNGAPWRHSRHGPTCGAESTPTNLFLNALPDLQDMAAALFRSKRRWSCFSNGRPAGAFLIVIDDLVNAEHRFPFVWAGGLHRVSCLR